MNGDNDLLHQLSHIQQRSGSSFKLIKLLALIAAVLLIAAASGVGGYWLGIRTNQNVSQSTQRASSQSSNNQIQSSISDSSPSPTPAMVIIGDWEGWKTYINQKYSYQVKYPPDKSYEELFVSGNEYTDFLFGCFRVFVVRPGSDDRDFQQKTKSTGIPWEKLNELENAAIGSVNIYSVDQWKIGVSETFTLKYSYKKLSNKQIGGLNWNTFEVTNNFENHTSHNIYFTNKKNSRYLIDMKSYGSCYGDKPVKMLSTFKFIN